MIFQGHALLPWRTVLGNVAYAVASKWKSWSRAKIEDQARKYIELVGLKGSELKKPAQLSGGHEAACGKSRGPSRSNPRSC